MDLETVFSDIVPIPMDDGPNPISPIAYPTEYSKAMDYFRACAKANEKSERLLDLTKEIIDLNPSHYTVWKVRQDCLLAIGADLHAELAYATEVGLENLKNYQIWHHRQVVVSAILASSSEQSDTILNSELDYINEQLALDSKNYHAWSYRQWLVKCYGFWEREESDLAALLDLDFRNNSAWNHRFFYFENRKLWADNCVYLEFEFALEYIRKAPNNESPWNYLKGIVRRTKQKLAALEKLENEVREVLKSNGFVAYAASFLLSLTEMKLTDTNAAPDIKARASAEAITLCEELIKNDIIRAKFWNYRLSLLQ